MDDAKQLEIANRVLDDNPDMLTWWGERHSTRRFSSVIEYLVVPSGKRKHISIAQREALLASSR